MNVFSLSASSVIAAALLLSACVSSSTSSSSGWEQTKRTSARIIVDGVKVNWGVVSSLGTDAAGNTTAFSSFTKQVNGQTSSAVLPVSERVAIAQKALAQHPTCVWKGFDPDHSATMSQSLGGLFGPSAKDHVIVFSVRC